MAMALHRDGRAENVNNRDKNSFETDRDSRNESAGAKKMLMDFEGL